MYQCNDIRAEDEDEREDAEGANDVEGYENVCGKASKHLEAEGTEKCTYKHEEGAS